MITHKWAGILYITFMGSAIGAEPCEVAPPDGTAFVKILLKNGNRIEKGCTVEDGGATLQDKLVELISPDSVAKQVIITYNCIDDGREVKEGKQVKVIPVWNCRITGRGIWKNGARTLEKEGINTRGVDSEGKDIENNTIADIEVYTTSITAYLDKKNFSIIDLLCL